MTAATPTALKIGRSHSPLEEGDEESELHPPLSSPAKGGEYSYFLGKEGE